MVTGEEHRRHRGFQTAVAGRVILEQHMELRRLLALGVVHTCTPSRDDPSATAALRALVGRIKKVFVDHLSYEDTALSPLLDGDLPDGRRRMQLLREEHARQRRELDALDDLSKTGSPEAFAERYDRLARTLLVDISREERELAVACASFDAREGRGRESLPQLTVQRPRQRSQARESSFRAAG
jgi:hypothetical protein